MSQSEDNIPQFENENDFVAIDTRPLEEVDKAVAVEDPTAEVEETSGLVAKLSKIDPYLIMLAVALAATVLACLALFIEWGSYRFITK